jgi:hypothetical protein
MEFLLKVMLNWLMPKPRLLGTNAQMKSLLAKQNGGSRRRG